MSNHHGKTEMLLDKWEPKAILEGLYQTLLVSLQILAFMSAPAAAISSAQASPVHEGAA